MLTTKQRTHEVTVCWQVQFVILLSYMVTVLVLQCNLPRLLTIFFIIQLTLFFCLFINFYLQTYKKKAVD